MVALFGNGLKVFPEVTVVAVGSNRYAATDGSVEILGVFLPLLEGVVLKELLVELPANLGNDDFLGVSGMLNGDSLGFQPGLELFTRALAAKELLEGVEINREVPVAAVGVAKDLVIDGMPLGEL